VASAGSGARRVAARGGHRRRRRGGARPGHPTGRRAAGVGNSAAAVTAPGGAAPAPRGRNRRQARWPESAPGAVAATRGVGIGDGGAGARPETATAFAPVRCRAGDGCGGGDGGSAEVGNGCSGGTAQSPTSVGGRIRLQRPRQRSDEQCKGVLPRIAKFACQLGERAGAAFDAFEVHHQPSAGQPA